MQRFVLNVLTFILLVLFLIVSGAQGGQSAIYNSIYILALFGSVLGAGFRPDSDVDMLVTFEDDADWGLLAHMQMQQELATLLQRPVDLISRRALEQSPNWVRREAILNTAQVIVSTGEVRDAPR